MTIMPKISQRKNIGIKVGSNLSDLSRNIINNHLQNELSSSIKNWREKISCPFMKKLTTKTHQDS